MAMKTTKSNWRIEIQPTAFAAAADHISDEACEEVCNGIMQAIIDGQCPEMPAHCVEVKCDEERICNLCGSSWLTDKKGNHLLRCVACGDK